MKKIIIIFLFCMLITACAGKELNKASMSETMSSPEKEALLKQRISEYWTAFIKKDYGTVFEMHDPFFRARSEKGQYIGKLGTLLYSSFKVTDIQFEGNVAKVKIHIAYSMKTAKVSKLEFEVPITEADIDEYWLYVYDNWYREHRSDVMEEGTAEY